MGAATKWSTRLTVYPAAGVGLRVAGAAARLLAVPGVAHGQARRVELQYRYDFGDRKVFAGACAEASDGAHSYSSGS